MPQGYYLLGCNKVIKSGARDVLAACAMQGQAACETSAPYLRVAQQELMGTQWEQWELT